LSRYFLGALMLSDSVLDVVRRELRRITPDVRINVDEIREVLVSDVIKREVLEGERAEGAKKKVARCAGKPLRAPNARADAPKEPAGSPA
jgi:hypothetical protein